MHYIIVKDFTGTSATTFDVLPSISVNPTGGIPTGLVNVTGSGFSGNSSNQQRNITILFFNTTGTTIFSKEVGAIDASDTGNFTVFITVPAVGNGPYYVSARDHATGTPNMATTSFTVSGSTDVSPTFGPSGAVVTVRGNGLSHQAGLHVSITLSNSTATSPAVELTPILTLADGTFLGSFIVPTLANGRYAVNAADPNFTITSSSDAGLSGFLVTGTTGITLNPHGGLGGDIITLTGQNFTAIAGTTVTVRFGQTPKGTITIATFTTTISGGFVGTVTVPNLPTSPPTYYINATDSNGLTQITTFLIASVSVFLSPDAGPTGSLVTATVFEPGITDSTTFKVTIAGTVVVASAPVTIGSSTAPFFVPTLPVGAYNVTVTDNLGFHGTTTFTVTATSALKVNPSAAISSMAGIGLSLTNFGAYASPNFYINNATNSYPLAVSPAAPFVVLTANSSGALLATFTVPPLTPGIYFVVANDTSGLFNATTTFTVTPNIPIIPEFQTSALLAFFMVLSAVVVVGIRGQKALRRSLKI
jgi:hypothetical protein